jgi:hypothetical protein
MLPIIMAIDNSTKINHSNNQWKKKLIVNQVGTIFVWGLESKGRHGSMAIDKHSKLFKKWLLQQ